MAEEIAEWCQELIAAAVRLLKADAAEFLRRAKDGDVEWMKANDLPVGEGMENVARQLGETFVKASAPIQERLGAFANLRPRDEAGERQQEERLRRRSEVGGLIAAANVELEILDAGLARAGKPEGVQEAIYVLAGFAVVGIVVPLTILALRPVPSVWWLRLLVVIGFAGGLGAVVAQLLIAVRRLARE